MFKIDYYESIVSQLFNPKKNLIKEVNIHILHTLIMKEPWIFGPQNKIFFFRGIILRRAIS